MIRAISWKRAVVTGSYLTDKFYGLFCIVLTKTVFLQSEFGNNYQILMVVVVQLVRTPDCGSGGRRFESGLPPKDL